ncbi:hypothetical protein F511_34371 [Dorcoceras hygrometricum]|uniref:Uncharacterized protein n=1 Tax=Dorcoceras hygrometricum TaxID=472368 RepID=A0A2Z7DEE3_9LAMI|nr:hypothetical protein F511_34371 [Dorcoceras hygrometricum]
MQYFKRAMHEGYQESSVSKAQRLSWLSRLSDDIGFSARRLSRRIATQRYSDLKEPNTSTDYTGHTTSCSRTGTQLQQPVQIYCPTSSSRTQQKLPTSSNPKDLMGREKLSTEIATMFERFNYVAPLRIAESSLLRADIAKRRRTGVLPSSNLMLAKRRLIAYNQPVSTRVTQNDIVSSSAQDNPLIPMRVRSDTQILLKSENNKPVCSNHEPNRSSQCL